VEECSWVSVCLSVCQCVIKDLWSSRHGAVPYLLTPLFGVATLLCLSVLSESPNILYDILASVVLPDPHNCTEYGDHECA